MASRSIDDLRHPVQGMARAFEQRCRGEGIEVLIYCTYRSRDEQDALYKIGRTLPGKRVTNARGGESAHNFGLAFDCVPLVGGKPQWAVTHPHWPRMGAIGESLGLEWAGRWKFREFPHFQLPNWRSYVQ